MEKVFAGQEHADQRPGPLSQNGLDRPSGRLKERGNYPGYTQKTSFYTQAVTTGSPALRTTLLAGAGLGLAAWLFASSAKNGNEQQTASVDDQK